MSSAQPVKTRLGLERSSQPHPLLNLSFQHQQVVQGFPRCRPGDDQLREPSWQAVQRAHDLLPGAHMRREGDDPLTVPQGLKKGEVRKPARLQGVDVRVGDALQGLARHIGPRGQPGCDEQRLLHQIRIPTPPVRLVDGAAAHAGIHLDEVRPDGGVLALHVEDAVLEAEGLDGADRQLLERHLLQPRQQRRRHRPSLVEVGLQGRAVVGDGGILPFALRHDDVNIHLGPVQIALQQKGHPDNTGGRRARAGAVVLHERSGRDHERPQLVVQLLIRGEEFALRAYLLDPERGGTRHRL
mmetsp:Transcript_6196/g.15180  ORF Transcript_6196/g.15180 Transcript_6196/m.15180 type:complete len:298 (-) Transcript_6196:1150-2043(-)